MKGKQRTERKGSLTRWANKCAKDVALDGIAFDPSQGKVPNVRGLGAKDAVYMLESCGLNVRLSGSGKVRSQSIPHGSKVSKGQTIYLTLK